MITLAPIPENIQNTLNQKIRMLHSGDRWPPPLDDNGAPITDGEQGIQQNYMFARSPWLRMTSFLPKNYKDVESGTSQKNIGWNPVILMGGEENDYGRMRAGFGDRKAGRSPDPLKEGDVNTFLQYSGLYNPAGRPASINMPFRPIPGVKDISVGYKGGGMKIGSTRTGEINWSCWTWDELDRLTPHFLSPGKTVLLEWGWTGVGALKNVKLLDIFKNDDALAKSFHPKKIDDLNSKIAGHIQDQDGHYDAILGLIQNFSWTVNENGGFDCTTNLISPGVTLLQIKDKKDKWKNFDSLPLLKEQSPRRDGGEGEITVEVAKKNQLMELSKISPYITFREYMSDFPSQIFHTFNHASEGNDVSADELKEAQDELQEYYNERSAKSAFKLFQSAEEREITDASIKEISAKIDALNVKLAQYAETSEGFATSTGGTDNPHFPSFRVDRFKLPSATGGLSTKGVGGVTWESFMHKVSRIGAYHFITWGWFEDNVLSRFFGKIGDSGDVTEGPSINKRVISEFRSIEQKVDPASGKLLLRDGSPDVQSTRFKNSRYLVTLDSSKWIIPNIGDPFWGFVETSRPDVKLDGPNWTWVQDTFLPYNMDAGGKKVYDGVDHMDIRSILFNVEYLSKMAKKGNDMQSAVLSVWDDFAREHGNVYKFKIEFDDDTKRMMVREEGYTQIRVAALLKNKLETEGKQPPFNKVPIYPNVYEFPIMEDGSIVKSQNINAKLPARMQVSAMYGSRGGLKGTDEEKQKKEQETYEDNVGRAWGKMSRSTPPSGDEASPAEKSSHLNDLLTGDMDFPSRQNREFGRMDANIFQNLTIGVLGKVDVDGNLTEIPAVGTDGTSIKPSILQDITEQQKIYIQEKKKIDFKKAKERSGKELTIAEIVKETELFVEGFAAFDSRTKSNPNVVTSELFCYEPGQYQEWSQGKESSSDVTVDEAGVETETVTPGEGYIGAVQGYTSDLGLAGEDDWALEAVYIQSLTNEWVENEKKPLKPKVFEPKFGLQTAFLTFKHTLRHSLIKLLRADRYGILANVDPLIPIDFEMEIDGTGGMFPGNSFHSSYLSDSYRRQAVFQMVGVDHTIDSSGWFTTVKGQIRSTSELPPAEMRTKKEKEAAEAYDKELIKAATKATAAFILLQKDKLDDIAQARKDALSKAKLRGDYAGQIAKYNGTNPKVDEPHRPVDLAAAKLYEAMKGGGTWGPQVYEALKTTNGLTANQTLLQQVFAKYCQTKGESKTDLRKWLDGDFDNTWSLDNYTQVAILAGYEYDGYKGAGWGDKDNANVGPPFAGPWIRNLNNSGTGKHGATRNIDGKGKPYGQYWIND